MKGKYLAGLAVGVLLTLGLGSPAHASLVVSGTVDYMGAARNLIYDTDMNITWLDYTSGDAQWNSQQRWADRLSLTVNGVTYDNWRLPSAGPSPVVGYGLNPASEMEHLFYSELGLNDYWDRGNKYITAAELNAGVFDNLAAYDYWLGTKYGLYDAWFFSTSLGGQYVDFEDGLYGWFYAMAVLPGQIQAAPEPASMLLVGAGLAGLVGLGSRRRGH